MIGTSDGGSGSRYADSGVLIVDETAGTGNKKVSVVISSPPPIDVEIFSVVTVTHKAVTTSGTVGSTVDDRSQVVQFVFYQIFPCIICIAAFENTLNAGGIGKIGHECSWNIHISGPTS